jgi:hypothetical protein
MKKLGSGENRHLAHSAFLIWTQTNDRDKTTTTTVIARGCLYSRRLYNARCSISTLVTSPQTFLFPTPFFILDFWDFWTFFLPYRLPHRPCLLTLVLMTLKRDANWGFRLLSASFRSHWTWTRMSGTCSRLYFILFSLSQKKVEILYLLSQRKYIKKEPKQNENIKGTVGLGNVG